MRLLDANIILRYLTREDPAKSQACRALMDRIMHGEEEATMNDLVWFEIVYVLTSPRNYGLSRVDVSERLQVLLSFRTLHLPNKRIHARALDVYPMYRWLDYADAYNIAQMEDEGIEEIISYDSGFDRVPGVRRLES